MKTFYLSLCILILSTFLPGNSFAQDKKQEKKVTISFTWSRIQTHGSNQIAIWIENTKGEHISTLFATKFTTQGGYIKRPLALAEWAAKYNLKDATKEQVDAVTGATPQSGNLTFTWNGKNKSGKVMPAGTYIVRMEANIMDADKMYFKGEIKIGGKEQKTNGEITYSSPNLASGNVLFKDVLVEYK